MRGDYLPYKDHFGAVQRWPTRVVKLNVGEQLNHHNLPELSLPA